MIFLMYLRRMCIVSDVQEELEMKEQHLRSVLRKNVN